MTSPVHGEGEPYEDLEDCRPLGRDRLKPPPAPRHPPCPDRSQMAAATAAAEPAEVG